MRRYSLEWWAHYMWQKHNLSPKDFYLMEDRMRAFFIASELAALDEGDFWAGDV